MKKLLLILAAAGFLASCSSRKNAQEQTIGDLVNDPQTLLVDVRTPEEFAAEPITGAINIPVNTIENRIKEFDPHKKIVVFCRSGIRAAKAKEILDAHEIPFVFSGTSYNRVSKLKAQNTTKEFFFEERPQLHLVGIFPNFKAYTLALKKNQKLNEYKIFTAGMLTVEEGDLLVKFGEETFSLRKGDVYELPLGEAVTLEAVKESKLTLIFQDK